jgi:hypothetical protein
MSLRTLTFSFNGDVSQFWPWVSNVQGWGMAREMPWERGQVALRFKHTWTTCYDKVKKNKSQQGASIQS